MLKCIETTPMRAEEWEQIKQIFDSAIKLSSAERASYLAGACGDNPGLLKTVGELLQAHSEARGFFLDEEPASPLLPPVFQVGQLVAGRFRIVRLICRGGMGEVYETFDERLAVRLALKTLRPEYAGDNDSLERFRREIRVTREISHPNLCRVYELVEHQMTAEPGSAARVATCLTMQLMSGETLQQYLLKHGRLSPEAALPFIKQIAGAIGVLHEHGIVHRDLKPSNVMISPSADGELRAIVMDFGLAKPFKGENEAFKSKSDFNAGAPFFLAPELVRGQRPSVASDIYAFGLIIDEMVTGGGAFSGDTVESILYQKLWSAPSDPLSRAPKLPHNWCKTIRRCLTGNPAKRPHSAALVARELSDVVSETQPVPQVYRALSKVGRLVPRLGGRHLSRRLSLLLIGVATLFIGAGTLFGVLGTRPLNTSIVTFDFENMTGKPENDYLTKGVAREIERRLLQIPGVAVMPFHDVRPKDAKIKLDARFSLEGQLQANRDITRLSVEVTENDSGKLICCVDSFEINSADTLEMQRAIASSAVQAMRDAVLLPNAGSTAGVPLSVFSLLHQVPVAGSQRALTPPTKSSAAMQFYMRGRPLWEQRTLPSLLQARDLYQRAIKEDNDYALAYADLAGVERALMQFDHFPRPQLLQDATLHARQAVEKGPEYAESYAALAAANQYAWDWQNAEKNYKRAIQLNPKLAKPHFQYGGFLMQFGRFEEGLKETRTAIALDPFDYSDRLVLGTYLCMAGRPAEAITAVNAFLAEKDFTEGHYTLAWAYAQLSLSATGSRKKDLLDKGLKEAAVLAAREIPSDPNAQGSISIAAILHGLAGDSQKARKDLDFLIRGEKAGTADRMDLIDAYMAIGDSASALKVISRAGAEKDSCLIYLKVDPFLQPLSKSVEFQSLVRQVGL